jgi:hypothetical protein
MCSTSIHSWIPVNAMIPGNQQGVGSYNASYTTTSAFKRRIERKHRNMPFDRTKDAHGALGREPGERFTAGKYQLGELLAELVLESSASLCLVEYACFHRFVAYFNGNALLVSHDTVSKDTAELKNKFQQMLLAEL